MNGSPSAPVAAPTATTTDHAGACMILWRHEGQWYTDWIKVSDLGSPSTRTSIAPHAYETLVEYSALKRQMVVEGPLPEPEKSVKDLTDDECEAYGDRVAAYNTRTREHQAWLDANAIFVDLPITEGVDIVALVGAVARALAKAIP